MPPVVSCPFAVGNKRMALAAHEMGHIVAHHSAFAASENLQRVLNVTQVGDEKDIVDKWNQYLNNYRRRKVPTSDYLKAKKQEDQHQEQPDNIALSLVARAGYSTQAFVDVFERIAETKGNTGNAWTDIFGGTTPDAKRLRRMVKDRGRCPAPAWWRTAPRYRITWHGELA